ncbi:hypothetical protein KQX54_011223 [Cotesia glomerata]|uniref:Uncharacterized protein n=1 Tax=Cotesia glomerata TaxID=32391 RepID=A0AAV7J4C1_COTGL|nr:hypothetical protein KQX54_011223 [Cotesia glomerata]
MEMRIGMGIERETIKSVIASLYPLRSRGVPQLRNIRGGIFGERKQLEPSARVNYTELELVTNTKCLTFEIYVCSGVCLLFTVHFFWGNKLVYAMARE